MSEQSLLSDLCSICNINKSKYRCPGCAARTCSLPCYKRHQQWAQCSGQRDPTKFVKKSQLVTPAGIDHDFNFLSGIERNLEKAEKAVNATPVGVQSDAKPRGQQGGINYSRLEAAGVKVIRAPQGLSRQKENKSHPSSTKKARHNVVWTVEWVNESKKRLITQTSSTALIKDAQPFRQNQRKKRKLGAEAPLTTDSSQSQDGAHASADQDKPHQQPEVEMDKPGHLHSSRGASSIAEEPEDKDTKSSMNVADPHSRGSRNDETSPEPLGGGQHRFYLLRPRTSSSRQVLIPLDPTHTLGESLNGRTVLEFPTIYAFFSSSSQLPEEFMLEEEYVRQEGEEQKEFDELLKELDPEILRRLKEDGPSGDGARGEEVDSKRILDVLKQDLGEGL